MTSNSRIIKYDTILNAGMFPDAKAAFNYDFQMECQLVQTGDAVSYINIWKKT